MSRARQIVAVVVGCSIAAVAFGQGAAPDREADHQALRQLLTKVTSAVSAHDVQMLKTVFAKEFVLTTIDQTVITNEAEFVAYNDRMFKDANAPVAKMETTAQADVLTRFTDENTGYCFGSALATYTMKDGRVIRLKERWTAVAVKEGAEWKMAAAHMGVNFLDNPVLSAQSMSIWRKIGIFLHLAEPPTD